MWGSASVQHSADDKLCQYYGYSPLADAVFTGGGTMSNFMGLLLARDHYSKKHFQHDIQLNGLPPEYSKFRIICADNAHFTVAQSASILGLGQQSVVKISYLNNEEEAKVLEQTIQQLLEDNLLPIAYVTTAGTTDFGSVGNLGKLAQCAQKFGLWFHVDAAYGGALMFSEKHRHKLAGIEMADSVTIDFHKLFYQPISCGVFMVKNSQSFEYIRLHADYLNPEGNGQLGILDLVYKSIQTTRRFDALKPFLALQHVGIRKFGEMIDYTIALAEAVSNLIMEETEFELACKSPINTVVFRFKPKGISDSEIVNHINNTIKTKLLLSGKAIVGQTMIQGVAFLKFTLLNPMTSLQEVAELLKEIKLMGKEMATQILVDKLETYR